MPCVSAACDGSASRRRDRSPCPDRRVLAALCRSYGVRRLSLFGLALREDFGRDSDVDLLVEFRKGGSPGLRFFELEDELRAIFGRRVDLHTPGFLAPRVRRRIRPEAEVLYETA